VAVLGVATACGGSGGSTGRALPPPATPAASPAGSASSPTPAATSAAVTSTTPPTTPPTAAATTPASSAATTGSAAPASAQPGLVLTGAGSALTPPGAKTVKMLGDATYACNDRSLTDAGFTSGQCISTSSKVGNALVLTETMGSQERTLAYTLRGRQATLALREVRTVTPATGNGSPSGSTSVSVSDLAGDGQSKLVVLTPQGSDTTQVAAVDVVEASGTVVLHRDLKGGTARKAPVGGGLETFTPAAGGKCRTRSSASPTGSGGSQAAARSTPPRYPSMAVSSRGLVVHRCVRARVDS